LRIKEQETRPTIQEHDDDEILVKKELFEICTLIKKKDENFVTKDEL